ncbi:MAG: RIP metalloprotease RseP [Balneolales bacterium]
MDWLFSLVTTLLIFGAAIFILVIVHELGHFVAAKIFGMRVDQFSIGFPPRLFGKKIGDTDYCISGTPLGGYVKIAGMIDESMDSSFEDEEPKPWEYRSKPVWQRVIVITAGVIMNMILAYVIFTGIVYTYGVNQIPAENIPGLYIPDSSLADKIGFETGDRILAVNDRELDNIENTRLFSMSDLTRGDLSFTVERNEEQVQISAPPGFMDELSDEPEFIDMLQNAIPSHVGAVQPGTPAEEAGLQEGDRIVSIDGEPVDYWLQMVEKIQNAESALHFEVVRNGEHQEFLITPDTERNIIGIAQINAFDYFDSNTEHYGLFASIPKGIKQGNDTFMGIINGFKQLFTGAISFRENLGGPVAIASVTAEATERGGMLGFWNITAFLSITLAIMNILPIPMLDGGHLMFLVYEGITRREPSMRVKMALQQIGFILLIGLMIFVTFNDILRYVG